MSALSLSTPIHTASTLTNARVSSRRTRVSSIKASCSSITLGAPSSHGLKGLKMATQRNQVLMQPNRGKLQVCVEEKRTARALFYSSSSSSKFFFVIDRKREAGVTLKAARVGNKNPFFFFSLFFCSLLWSWGSLFFRTKDVKWVASGGAGGRAFFIIQKKRKREERLLARMDSFLVLLLDDDDDVMTYLACTRTR